MKQQLAGILWGPQVSLASRHPMYANETDLLKANKILMQ